MRYIGDTQAGIAANYHEPDEHRKHASTLVTNVLPKGHIDALHRKPHCSCRVRPTT